MSKNTLTIRRAMPGEEITLSALAGELFRQGYGDTHPEPDISGYIATNFSPEAVARDLNNSTVAVLVGETKHGRLAAYAIIRESDADRMEIARFYVDREFHGTGAAQSLMDACIDEARRRGKTAIWLQAWQEAGRALAFYRKSGFEVFDTAKFEFGARIEDDYLLVRPVADALANKETSR